MQMGSQLKESKCAKDMRKCANLVNCFNCHSTHSFLTNNLHPDQVQWCSGSKLLKAMNSLRSSFNRDHRIGHLRNLIQFSSDENSKWVWSGNTTITSWTFCKTTQTVLMLCMLFTAFYWFPEDSFLNFKQFWSTPGPTMILILTGLQRKLAVDKVERERETGACSWTLGTSKWQLHDTDSISQTPPPAHFYIAG